MDDAKLREARAFLAERGFVDGFTVEQAETDRTTVCVDGLSLLHAVAEALSRPPAGKPATTASSAEGLLREARGYVQGSHDEGCELDPEYGEQNMDDEDGELERYWPDDAQCTCGTTEFLASIDAFLATERTDAGEDEVGCPSCNGLNISCPDGCGRDPETGELNGTCYAKPDGLDPQTLGWPIGIRVTKTKGSSWTGKVVGFYSTSLTPEGYAVESENEPGSVQIYPRAALAQKAPKP